MNSNVNDTILYVNSNPPGALKLGLAARVKARRLEINLTQKGMAARTGIPLATYRRFEATGDISVSNLILISVVLRMTTDIEKLFSERRYQNIDDVINADKFCARKRGRKNG